MTGASGGIGPFIAEALAAKGAHLALSARSAERLNVVAESLQQYGVRTLVAPADLLKPEDRQELTTTVLKEFGNIEIVVNNAGLEPAAAFLDITMETIRQTVEVNLLAPIELTRLVLPHLIERGSGHIVNIASLAAKRGAPFDAIYSGTKAGLDEWTRGLRVELAGTGVLFSTILPGYVTEAGMFARYGMTAPWTLGSCTPVQVARAVVKSLERRRLEIIINSRPMRPLIALGELFPAFGDWLMHRLGIVRFQKAKVSGQKKA